LDAGGKTRAAAPAQSRIRDGGDYFAGGKYAALRQRLIAVASEVIFDVQGVDLAAVFQHDADPSGLAPGCTRRRLMPPGTEVMADDLAGGLGGHVAIERDAAGGFHYFHQRFAVAHAVAAHGFDRGAIPRRLLQGSAHRFAAAGDAAGAEPDAEFHRGLLHVACPSASHAVVGVSLPEVWPSTVSTGARLQQPRQATSSTVNRRCASVSAPSGMAR